ncbi:protein virilizer homolog isoform X2 [Acipenser ruthenus]|uniref:protein virilizer homolog isoform X2 n=1 Tax=Acipenser ruthenus TaxID=7906 RepID=UPI0027407DD3|nr:protein virilizer homolog isoform X2 [Acipenser ruthenus]
MCTKNMAVDSAMELLFLDTFKHQSSEITNVDVVRFPCGVLVNEVRVIPPGIRAHSNLQDSRVYGETSPHAFQLDLFFNNVSKPSAPVFDRLGSLDYDENKSIVFRPNGKVNTDGLVLKGWYNCLTLAVYGTAERALSHDRDSPPPPPPPPPPPQQQAALKRNPKHDWDKEDQYTGSPPRPQPRGPRTPPGPPPPDDDEEEAVPESVGIDKEDGEEAQEDFFEPISPDRTSIPPEEPYLDMGELDEEEAAAEEEAEEEEIDGDEEDDDDERTVCSIVEEDEEEEGEEDDDEEEKEEEGEGDDGYEQISSDEEAMLEHESYKFPSFDINYTPEDLASVPTMQYDPYERDIRPMLYFNPPYRTTFEIEVNKMKDSDLHEDASGAAEPSAKLIELLELYREDRGAKWVMALEEVPGLLVKGLSYLQVKDSTHSHLRQLVDWTMHALCLQAALSQPIALNVRQLKAGTKLASSLAECGSQAVVALVESGIINRLFELLFAEHVSSSLKLNTLKSLDSLISISEGMEAFLNCPLEGQERSGYQKLVDLILLDQTVRVVTAGTAIVQKGHFYEILSDLQKTASQVGEIIPPPPSNTEPEPDSSLEKTGKEEEGDLEAPMDMDPLLESYIINEGDIEKLISMLYELLHLMETATHTMIQPPVKSFPTTARITGPPERDDPYPVLFRYMHSRHFLESLTVVLSVPATSLHPGVLQAVKDLLRFLAQTQKGLLFLMAEHDATSVLTRVLTQITEQEPDEGIQVDSSGEDPFAVWLMQALHALQCVAELFDHFGGEACIEEGDSTELLGILHSLYLISFNSTGRSAVSHVLSSDQNFSCLLTLLDHYSKEGLGETKSRKSVTYNYACMLVLLVVQSSNDVRMLEHYGAPLLKVCKADENNVKLQELSKWLEPLEKLQFEINCIPILIEYIKQNLDNLITQEGAGLMTALRILCQIACTPPAVEGQQKDLKWNLAVIQLFSAEGMDTFIKILQKLNSILIQPWRLHGNMGTSLQRSMIVSVACNTLRLLKCMLTELLRSGSFEFKDTRVPSTLVALHMVLCSIPLSGRLDSEEQKIQSEIIDILLTFTQGVNEQATDTEETLANNTWSLMLKEVLSTVLKTPEGFFSGLALISELLPLPLPMQTTQAIAPQDIAVALNTRKLWSMHLHVHAKLLQDIVRSFSGTTCQPLLHMLRRVCVQLCDLASPTALLIMRTVVELIAEELEAPPEGKEKACTVETTRLFALLDSLVSHRACKVAVLHLLSGASKGDEKFPELFPSILGLLQPTGDNNMHQQHCAEFIATVIQSLCDQDIALIVTSPSESSVSETEQLTNALPSKDLLSTICDRMLEALTNTEISYTLVLTCIRTMMFLTEHHYGLFYLRSFLKKHDTALFCLLKRVVLSFNKESAELVLALLEFLRQIFNTHSLGCCGDESMTPMDVDGSSPARSLAFSVTEMKQLLQWKESSQDHLLHELEKQLTEYSKDDDSLESVLENVVGLRQMLDSDSNATVSTEQDTEPVLPAPESLQTQFNNRTVYVLADVFDDQLKTLWLSPFQAEEIDMDLDMVKVDLVELSQRCCTDFDLKAELERSFLMEPSSPGRSKAAKGFKLGKHKHETFITSSGKLDYIEPAKRAHIMALPRGRGRGAFGQLCRPHDIFRQRKQNTSRPPSMHVDDFVAAEIKDIGPPTGLLLPKRTVKGSLKALSRGLFSGNRGGRGVFHSQTRFFSPPAPKGLCTSRDLCRPWETSMVQHPLPVTHGAALAILRRNYNRREGGRGSAWSPQGTPGTHRGTYNEGRGGQNNFNRGPPQSRQPAAGGYRLAPRDRAPRGRGVGPSWASGGGGGSGSRGKFGGGGGSGSSSGGRGRHVRSFTR